MNPQVLVEHMELEILPDSVTEDESTGRMRLKGVFQRCEVKNKNGRKYRRSLWENQLREDAEPMQRVRQREMMGHLEHPRDGVTRLNEVAILTTGLSLDEDGRVIGEAEILSTPAGRIAQSLIRDDVRLGISSRGMGTVGPDGYVQDDFRLVAFDLVSNPSTPGAHPSRVPTQEAAPVSSASPSKEECRMSAQEKYELLERRVEEILSEGTDDAPRSALVARKRDLLNLSSELGGIAEDEGLKKMVDTLMTRIAEARQEVDESLRKAVHTGNINTQSRIDEGRNNPSDDGSVERLAETIEELLKENNELHELVNDSTKLIEAQDEQLAEAAEAISEVAEINEHLAELVAEARLDAATFVEALEEEEDRYYTAQEIIEALTATDENDITLAVDEAVRLEPELEDFRDLLEAADTVDHVSDIANRLLSHTSTPGTAASSASSDNGDPNPPASSILSEAVKALRNGVTSEDDAGVNESHTGQRSSSNRGAGLVRRALSSLDGRG